MVTISVPINSKQEKFIESFVKSGRAANKAHAVRRAIDLLSESEAVRDLMESEGDVRSGRVYEGDLRKLVKRTRD
jgi:Arc/MetJ-type ribon-helix-helix transcriptional regulator